MEIKLRGFAANKQLASEAAKLAKSKQSKAERSRRGRAAVMVRWDKYKRDGLDYEDTPELNPKAH